MALIVGSLWTGLHTTLEGTSAGKALAWGHALRGWAATRRRLRQSARGFGKLPMLLQLMQFAELVFLVPHTLLELVLESKCNFRVRLVVFLPW
jgi:hypothetical protein